MKFARPPVVEVSFGVSFRESPRFAAAHVGAYWATIREQFPKTQDQRPSDPIREVFDGSTQQTKFELVEVPPLRRSWFISADASRLIQVQGDRFNFNVSRDASRPYAGFSEHHPEFQKALTEFGAFFQDTCGQAIEPLQFELTYVNVITPGGPFQRLLDVGRVLRDIGWNPQSKNLLTEPENFSWKTSFAMPEQKGRLHVVLNTGVSKGQPALRLMLVARGYVKGDHSSWFDLAHTWIVDGFAELTTSEMHQHWGKLP